MKVQGDAWGPQEVHMHIITKCIQRSIPLLCACGSTLSPSHSFRLPFPLPSPLHTIPPSPPYFPPGVYNADFIAANQEERADNLIKGSKAQQVGVNKCVNGGVVRP